jgi:hypothetical protein
VSGSRVRDSTVSCEAWVGLGVTCEHTGVSGEALTCRRAGRRGLSGQSSSSLDTGAHRVVLTTHPPPLQVKCPRRRRAPRLAASRTTTHTRNHFTCNSGVSHPIPPIHPSDILTPTEATTASPTPVPRPGPSRFFTCTSGGSRAPNRHSFGRDVASPWSLHAQRRWGRQRTHLRAASVHGGCDHAPTATRCSDHPTAATGSSDHAPTATRCSDHAR